jgi:hypothetical protein
MRLVPGLLTLLAMLPGIVARAQTYSYRADQAGCTVNATSAGTNAVVWAGANCKVMVISCRTFTLKLH